VICSTNVLGEADMKFTAVVSAVIVVTTLVTGTAGAQGTAQTITSSRVDVIELASGYRTSKVVGATIYDENRERIGTVDDLVVSPKDSVTYVILSVGGFLGLGTHLVAVPFSTIEIADKQMHLRGGTRESLKALPEFKYASP
jgi:sporulation protein YlmC with PRC-barrel domain